MVDLFDSVTPRVPVAGGQHEFPVHRIYCIGRNYADHVREMGGAPERNPPVYFLKPSDAVVPLGGAVSYPPRTDNLHYEIELVAAVGKGGSDIAASDAREHIFGYAVGIDLTRRDLQHAAKADGGPWDTAKSFEQAAPISAIHAAADVGHPRQGRIWLSVNGEGRQEADLAEMIWSIDEAVADLSTYFTLTPGDLLFSGTPAGVGAVHRGDRLRGGVDGVASLDIELV
ncbi:MAG: fumarylacetoacetate hydrolase family protein [Pseudomonadota bacterium]